MKIFFEKKEKLEMLEQEFEHRLKTEEAKTGLDISLLNEKLDLSISKLSKTHKSLLSYESDNGDRIEKYDKKDFKKNGFLKFFILVADIVVCIGAGQNLGTSWLENIAYACIQATLIFLTSDLQAKNATNPAPEENDKQLAGIAGLLTIAVVIFAGCQRYAASEAGGWLNCATHLALSFGLYLVIYMALRKKAVNKETEIYFGLKSETETFEKERLGLFSEIVDVQKSFEDFKLNNLLESNRAKLNLDTEDIRKAKMDLEQEKQEAEIQALKQKKEEESRKKEEARILKLERANAAKLEEKAEQERLTKRFEKPDFIKNIGRNGTLLVLVASLFFFTSCNSDDFTIHGTESAVTVFVDPSPAGSSEQFSTLIPSGEDVLGWMNNSLDQFTTNGGRYDLFIMKELYGMQHFSAELEPLAPTAHLEKKKSLKHLKAFTQKVNQIGDRVDLPPDGYGQSRILVNLFDALHFLQQKPQERKVLIIISDLLEHTARYSLLDKTPEELEESAEAIFEYLDRFCACKDLSGIEVVLGYQADSEAKFDEQRVVMKRLVKHYFSEKNASVKLY